MRRLITYLLLFTAILLSGCGKHEIEGHEPQSHHAMPALGSKGKYSGLFKNDDVLLQNMITSEMPQFKVGKFDDIVTGHSMQYNLFSPAQTEGKRYPIVIFMADNSTPGNDVRIPLIQGYGGLIWASAQWQKSHPCFVIVPQFNGICVNDDFQHTYEPDLFMRLLDSLVNTLPIDRNRIYFTGQSMGGMVGMYYNIKYPGVIAASMFVECHWDLSKFDKLVRNKFIYFIAGNLDKSNSGRKAVENNAKKLGIKYVETEFSAKLPMAVQDSIVSSMLSDGADINIIRFAPGSVLPENPKVSEHMYAFDAAYRILPAREWLFAQSK